MLHQELNKPTEKSPRPFAYKMAEAKPELVYAACITLSHFYNPTPAPIFNSTAPNTTLYQPLFTMPTPASRGITVGWNYSDALDAFIAAHELLSEDTYHKNRNRVKAALNIVSGTQLLIFSDNYGLTNFGSAALAGATALASPAFAFAMLCDLLNLTIDLICAAKEAKFEGWLEERLLEMRHLEKRIAEESDSQKKAVILTKKNKLEEDIAARCRVYYAEGYEGCKYKAKKKRKEAIEEIFARAGQDVGQQLFGAPTKNDKEMNANIQKELSKKLDESLTNWAVKFVSFTGMTLLAVSSFVACPPLVFIGTMLVTAVSIYYAQKHCRKLISEGFSLGLFLPKIPPLKTGKNTSPLPKLAPV